MINLIEKFRAYGLEPRSYSGRAMYGKQCVGVSGDQRELMRAISCVVDDCLQEAEDHGIERGNDTLTEDYEYTSLEELQKFVRKLLDYKQDQMGLGMIYYWPSIKWEEEEE